MTQDNKEEPQYQTVTLSNFNGIEWEKIQQPLGWYSIHGGKFYPEPDMRTGYQRLRSWFWNKAHDLSDDRGYCDGGCC